MPSFRAKVPSYRYVLIIVVGMYVSSILGLMDGGICFSECIEISLM